VSRQHFGRPFSSYTWKVLIALGGRDLVQGRMHGIDYPRTATSCATVGRLDCGAAIMAQVPDLAAPSSEASP
jgi:hypothetical protein